MLLAQNVAHTFYVTANGMRKADEILKRDKTVGNPVLN